MKVLRQGRWNEQLSEKSEDFRQEEMRAEGRQFYLSLIHQVVIKLASWRYFTLKQKFCTKHLVVSLPKIFTLKYYKLFLEAFTLSSTQFPPQLSLPDNLESLSIIFKSFVVSMSIICVFPSRFFGQKSLYMVWSWSTKIANCFPLSFPLSYNMENIVECQKQELEIYDLYWRAS